MKFRLLLLSLIVSGAAFAGGPGNPDAKCCKKNDVTGGIIHAQTKRPLSNVSVTAYSTSRKEKVIVSDNNGNYDFNELKPGTYKLVFEKQGFNKIIKDKIIIRPDEGLLLNIEMSEVTTDFQILPGVILTDLN
jgi:hypothetical protein